MLMIKEIKKTLREIGFSENETKIYLALTQLGEATAAQIAKKADLPRTTAISILDKLDKDKYISIQKYKGRHNYWVESPHVLKDVFLGRAAMADSLDKLLANLYRSEADFPYAKIYDSKSSIKSFIERTILNMKKESVIFTIDNPKAGNYTRILSENFYYDMLAMKKKNKILTKTLVPFGMISQIDSKKIETQDIILQEMPPEINFKCALWIMKDTVVLFSGKYPFVVAVRHSIITESIKSIFDFLWNISAKI